MQFIQHVQQPMNADTNSCTDTEDCITHKDSDTNLPYSPLVTLRN